MIPDVKEVQCAMCDKEAYDEHMIEVDFNKKDSSVIGYICNTLICRDEYFERVSKDILSEILRDLPRLEFKK